MILLGLFFCVNIQAQEKKQITIRNADTQQYKRTGNNDLIWLVGNVIYEHEDAVMQCDSSILYRRENRFMAYGNVRITMSDSITLLGNQMTYDGNSRILLVTGNVFMTDGSMTLRSHEITYDRNNQNAYYLNGGTLNQEDNKLDSKRGYYNTITKMLKFRENVVLVNPDFTIVADTLNYGAQSRIAYFLGPTTISGDSSEIYCELGTYDTRNYVANLSGNPTITKGAQTIKGDSIHYKEKSGSGEIFGKAFLSDTTNKYVITGQFARYREKPEYAMVTGKPLYALKIEEDSLYITGDTLVLATDFELKRKIRVFRNSKFYKLDFQGKSDSLTYTESDSTFHLYHNPVVWNEENQLTADFIFLTTKNGNLDSLHMIGNAFMISQEDSIKYNQIKGRNMFGKFNENELQSIYVSGNGQTVYYAYDGKDEEVGVNRADCSNLIIQIKESKVDRVTFLTKPEATLYPPDQIPQGELYLKGFNPRFKEKILNKEDLLKN